MKRLILIAALTIAPALSLAHGHAGGGYGGHAGGGGHADVHLTLPAHPSMAAVRPGVQVVVGLDDEVFYSNDYYWLRRGDGWYHARHHGDAFVYVEDGDVPSALIEIPAGEYIQYPGGIDDGDDGYGHHGHGYGHHAHGYGHHGHGYGGGHGYHGGC